MSRGEVPLTKEEREPRGRCSTPEVSDGLYSRQKTSSIRMDLFTCKSISCSPLVRLDIIAELERSAENPSIIHSSTAVAACSNSGVTTTHENGSDQLPKTNQSSNRSCAHRSADSLPPAARQTAHITGSWNSTSASCCSLLVRGRLMQMGRARTRGRGRRRARQTDAPKLSVATMEMVSPPRRRLKHLRMLEGRAAVVEPGAAKRVDRSRGVRRRTRIMVAGS